MPNELVIKRIVDSNRDVIIKRLPRYITPEQFFALCYSLDRNPKLANAAQRNPDGLLNAILRAADCGLVIGSAYDHCTLIPYADEIQLSINYRGLVYQLVRAGAVLKIDTSCVYKGDKFHIELGDEDRIIHKPDLHDDHRRDASWLFDKKNIEGAYAIGWLPTPPLKARRWCPLGEIEAARARSKVPDGPAWKHSYPAMAMKTAVRRLTKLIEVCGPTDENREAWDRFGRTIDIEKSEYKDLDDDEPDDLPGNPPDKSTPQRSGKRRAEAGAGVASAVPSPPPQNGERKTAAAAPPPPPPQPPPDEPISMEMQDKLIDLAKLTGMRPTALFKHVKETYGVQTLDALQTSQAAELEKYLKANST